MADAEAFYTLLTTTGGFKKDKVLLLTDRCERKPALRNIKFALGTFLGRSAQQDDTVIVYLAGQGAIEVDARGQFAAYFLPGDVNAGGAHDPVPGFELLGRSGRTHVRSGRRLRAPRPHR